MTSHIAQAGGQESTATKETVLQPDIVVPYSPDEPALRAERVFIRHDDFLQPKTLEEYDAAMKAATDKLTQLYKADPNSAETKAANAELLKLAQGKSALMNAPAQQTGGAAAYTETPEYKKLLANLQSAYKVGPESPAYKKAMADLEAYTKAQTPAPVAESGFANEELSRILSLVHHR